MSPARTAAACSLSSLSATSGSACSPNNWSLAGHLAALLPSLASLNMRAAQNVSDFALQSHKRGMAASICSHAARRVRSKAAAAADHKAKMSDAGELRNTAARQPQAHVPGRIIKF